MLGSRLASPLKILLALDDTPNLNPMVNMLTHIKWPDGTLVHMLAVVPEKLPVMDTSPEARQQINETEEISRWRSWAAAKFLATEAATKLLTHRLVLGKTDICQGNLGEVVQESAAELRPDLVVISDKKYSIAADFWQNLARGKAASLARQSSVLVVRPSPQICPLNTILAVDGSPEAWRAVKFVSSLSLPDWARITVVSVAGERQAVSAGVTTVQSYASAGMHQDAWPLMPSMAEALATEAVNYLHDRGISVRWCCRSGSFVSEVVALAQEENADLIVTGARTKKGGKSIHRSDPARKIINDAPCSVLVVR
jgi:nucleotide-binding universal stress UspA family protein